MDRGGTKRVEIRAAPTALALRTNEADKTITTHIESCTFPNWNGTDRKVTFNISGDELDTVSTATPSTGTGTAHLVWRRAK